MIRHIRTIDAHVGGQAVRLVVDGAPRVEGRTLAHKREWLRRSDAHRRAIVLEPRGHRDLSAAMLTEPVSPGAHAGLLFMDADGYPSLRGHVVIAAATIALERHLLFSRDLDSPEVALVFDTPAGPVHARARLEQRGSARRVDAVAFAAPPAFVHTAAHAVRLGPRELRVDVAFGGEFYAIVDTEAIGVPLQAERLPELRRLGADICRSMNAAPQVTHPADAQRSGVTGVILTGPSQDPEAHLRNVTVSGTGIVNRSPGGTATAAVMAVLDAMGLLLDDQPFVHESLTGALFRGRPVRRTQVNDIPALVSEITGTAWVTGEHVLEVDEDDPFREGFRL